MSVIYLYLLFILQPCVFGVLNAFIYGRKGADSFEKIDEHWFIVGEVACFMASVLAVSEFKELISVWDVRIAMICYLLSNPFFKDGFYFLSRKWIDKAYGGFFDDSITSTAPIDFKVWLRVSFQIISLFILIYYAATN